MIKHYMRPDSNTPPAYLYVVGDESDCLWNPKTCIEVEPRPTINHEYDLKNKVWMLNEVYYMNNLRYNRNLELENTDKFMLSDYPISTEDKNILIIYRQQLRDITNKEKIEDRKLPNSPSFVK